MSWSFAITGSDPWTFQSGSKFCGSYSILLIITQMIMTILIDNAAWIQVISLYQLIWFFNLIIHLFLASLSLCTDLWSLCLCVCYSFDLQIDRTIDLVHLTSEHFICASDRCEYPEPISVHSATCLWSKCLSSGYQVIDLYTYQLACARKAHGSLFLFSDRDIYISKALILRLSVHIKLLMIEITFGLLSADPSHRNQSWSVCHLVCVWTDQVSGEPLWNL